MIDKRPLNWWLSFERAGGYAAGFATGLLGFAQIFWDPNRQAIHDKVSETIVIQDGKEPVPGPWIGEGKASGGAEATEPPKLREAEWGLDFGIRGHPWKHITRSNNKDFLLKSSLFGICVGGKRLDWPWVVFLLPLVACGGESDGAQAQDSQADAVLGAMLESVDQGQETPRSTSPRILQ